MRIFKSLVARRDIDKDMENGIRIEDGRKDAAFQYQQFDWPRRGVRTGWVDYKRLDGLTSEPSRVNELQEWTEETDRASIPNLALEGGWDGPGSTMNDLTDE
ncbi:hypothetical protein EYZ11_001368 [Aspergillus tanneri]|uniref:Uncharacterized protein n=1 Tax=Aspergillus tanneri TaxID=1220188 RepID=A0A4S3JUY7_9EURO|nr:hypothetical protein EYZ11_001368 [Aspergillus tanneri]